MPDAFPAYSGLTYKIDSSGNMANSPGTAVVSAVANKLSFITGFSVGSGGATAASLLDVTVSDGSTFTLHFPYAIPAGVTLAAPLLVVTFPVPIPAGAKQTAITVTCPAAGAGNTLAAVNAFGFQIPA